MGQPTYPNLFKIGTTIKKTTQTKTPARFLLLILHPENLNEKI